ncbi:MAG: XrtA/PEP-CTERM system TPR-repeat protein PrsT [Pseudomonadota bacterium]
MNRRPRPTPSLLVLLLAIALAGCGKSPEQHFEQGKALFEKGDSQGAILELKTTLQAQPNNAEARLLLGRSYLATEAYAAAEKELQAARQGGIAIDRVLPLLARATIGMGEPQKALDLGIPPGTLNRADSTAMHVIRAEALQALGKQAEAEQAMAVAEGIDATHPDLLLLKARQAVGKHDLARASELLDAALAKNPQLTFAYYLKGAILEEQKRFDDAVKTYQTALRHDPKAYRAQLSISDLEFNRGNSAAGEEALKTAEKLAPNQVLVKYARGYYELRRNHLKAANDTLLQVLRVAPDYTPAVLAQAMVNLGLGNYEQSLKAAQLVLGREPNNTLAARLVAASQIESGDPRDALATLAPMLQRRPDHARLLALSGEAYMQSKDYQNALKQLRQAAQADPTNPQIRLREAQSLLALGEPEQAIATLEQAVKLSPKAGQADVAIIGIHLQRKDFDKALQAIANLERKLPNNANTHSLRAAALLGKGDRAGARKALEQALALQHDFIPAAANLARMDLAEKNPKAARQRFVRILDKAPGNADAMLALAELALLDRQEAEHVEWLQKAIKADPRSLQARRLLSRHYLSKKDFPKALAEAEDAVKNLPDDPLALDLLGSTQSAAGAHKAAIDTYRQLIKKQPNSAEAYYQLGLAQIVAKQTADARASLAQSLQINPDLIVSMHALIRLDLEEKKPDSALEWARKIQAARPNSPTGYEEEGNIQMQRQQAPLAAKAYQQALEKGAGTPVLIKLHDALRRAGDTKGAQSRLEAWVRARPGDLLARAYLASQAILNGQDKVAIAQYEEILRLQPNDLASLNNLANLYQRQKDPRALALAEKVYKASPENPLVQDTLGWILLERGEQLQKAMELLRKASTRAIGDPSVQYHYAVALARSGDKAGAREALRKALNAQRAFPEAADARALLSSLS